MRAILCVTLLVLFSTAARAEHLWFKNVAVTYWSADQSVEVYIEANRPIDMESDLFRINGLSKSPPQEPYDQFSLRSYPLFTNDNSDGLRLYYTRFGSPGGGMTSLLGEVPHTANRNILVASFPFDLLDFPNPEFTFVATVFPQDGDGVFFTGQSHIDQRVFYVPEPSSIEIASIGLMGFAVYLIRRPRIELRRRQRQIVGHVGGECAV